MDNSGNVDEFDIINNEEIEAIVCVQVMMNQTYSVCGIAVFFLHVVLEVYYNQLQQRVPKAVRQQLDNLSCLVCRRNAMCVEQLRMNGQSDDGATLQQENLDLDDIDFSDARSNRKRCRRAKKRPAKKLKASDKMVEVLSKLTEKMGQFFQKLDAHMEKFDQKMGYARDLSNAKMRVNDELKRLPLSQDQRLKASTTIINNAPYVDFFLSLSDEDMMVCIQRINGHH